MATPPPGSPVSCKNTPSGRPRSSELREYVSPSAIRGNLVAHRPLDRSLSFPQAGIVNVVNGVSDTDPCSVSRAKAQEVATGSEQVDWVVKRNELSQFIQSAQVSSPPITRHLMDLSQACYHEGLLLRKWRMAPPVLIPPDLRAGT